MPIVKAKSSWGRNCVSLEHAAPGDVFITAEPTGNAGVYKLSKWTVKRVLKRDVVCVDMREREQRFNINHSVDGFVSQDDPDFQEIFAIHEKARRRMRANNIAHLLIEGAGAHLDDEIIEALFAFEDRHKARLAANASQPD